MTLKWLLNYLITAWINWIWGHFSCYLEQECLAYGEFLQTLRTSPQLLASCLVAGDHLLPDMMHGVIHSIMAGLFGSCLLPEDKLLALRLLRYLTELQLVPSENPRRYVVDVSKKLILKMLYCIKGSRKFFFKWRNAVTVIYWSVCCF